ncbi:hypothetical protein L3Q82_018495, partial [Scortum barcoo]
IIASVTKQITRYLQDLETEVQHLLSCTADQGHIEGLKSKKAAIANLLGITAEGALTRSRFMNASMLDSSSFSACRAGTARGRSSTVCARTMGLHSLKPLRAEGMPQVFIETFLKQMVGEDMLEVFQESFRSGLLPQSCRRAVITLLPKKGDLQDLKNWRPVSLLLLTGTT